VKRIAVINPFPNVPQTAEAEWIRRFYTACDRLGFEPIEVITSDDVIHCNPDCVLATHEVSPKLTEFPTLGLHWNPPDFFAQDPLRCKAVLSLDGHLCGSRQIADWIDDFSTSHGKRAVIHDSLMLPSTPDAGAVSSLPSDPAIFYAGVHWEGSRHDEIFRALDRSVPLRLYGPPNAWAGYHAYRGLLPFDGVSIIGAIRDAGIALCLHRRPHRQANCPSMRLFEAAAAGALIITDDFEFPRYWFRNSVLYVNADVSPDMVTRQIVSHVKWARQNSEHANRLAARSNELFRHHLNLERMLISLPEFVDQVRTRRSMVVGKGRKGEPRPVVEYIIRIGLRPAETIARALASLAAQTYQEIAIVLVQFHSVLALDAVIDTFRSRFRWIRHIVVSNNGTRSTSWWAGLNALSAPFFGMLDDDDTLFPNHVASLMDRFKRSSECGFVYSGLIKYEEEPGHYVNAPQFNGPSEKVIEERREIFVLSEEDFTNLLPNNNVIGNHSWICRTSLLDSDVLADPKIEWGEDVYFTALMAGRTKFAFTAMATALWHWRSTTKDNWSLSHSNEAAEASLGRWQARLQSVNLPSLNRVPKPPSQYNPNEAMLKELPTGVYEKLKVGSCPLANDFLIGGLLMNGASELSPPITNDSASIVHSNGRQTQLSTIANVIIHTTPMSYCYSLVLNANPSIAHNFPAGHVVTVEVSLEVILGRIGIGWAAEDYRLLEPTERYLRASMGVQRVLVSVPSENVHYLTFRNLTGDGTKASFKLIGLRSALEPLQIAKGFQM
jgi:hypothetical protein